MSLFFFQNLFAQDEFFEPKTTLGGYGELHYNLEKTADTPASKLLDFHRFVLFYSHTWTEKWSLKAEVELEHNFVKEGQGELELEQAHINYHHSNAFGFQVGVILPSVGLINEVHEPPVFLSVERPEYSKNIIPTTWFGNGLAVYGRKHGFDYKIAIMEGLNADGISNKSAIRGARLKGYKSNARELLYNGRVNFSPVPGFMAGFSYSQTKAMGTDIDIPLTLFEVHAQLVKKNVHMNFEWGTINYDDSDLEKSSGYYFDLGYDISTQLGINSAVIPWVRVSDYNTAASTRIGGDSEKEFHYSKWLAGLSVKPIDEVVFKIDYGVRSHDLSGQEIKLFNIGAGYMF
ncbi:MAG: hypothetical protein DWQ05_06350 [Calditrichaeota bacterium]|nr:MAG: hypothetical protein DWQ05_06350 [Calditrichota bacterium]